MTAEPSSTTYTESPAVEQAVEDSLERRDQRLTGRERAVEVVVGGGFGAVAVALLVAEGGLGSFPWLTALLCVAVFAAASRVTFDVGASYTMPCEVVFVPMLFLVPPAAVPACVAPALLAGKLGEALVTRRPPSRALLAFGDSWFAIGPAVVFAVAAPGAPDGHDWPVYLAALGAQVAVDAGSATVRDVLNGTPRVGEQTRAMGWVWLVDGLLAPVGLAVAFAAVARPWVMLLLLPLLALFAVFARERAARWDQLVELGRAYRGTALVLGNVVEADDEYTGFHSQEVVELSVAVADELRLDATARRNVEFGALLHDVGKITVPKAIINKPGALDEAEWRIMRRHTIEGQALLDQVGGFMSEVGRIVRASHERFDGTGYPDGLPGEDIPLEARVVSCCDAFNAMTTDRSYRKARPVADAIAELRRCSGTQFDPRVVDAVIAVVERTRKPTDGAELLPEPTSLLLERTS